MPRSLLYILFILSLLAGCVSISRYSSTTPYQITHHTWWNYYQRGRLYLQDKKYAEAAADFETALGLRPGARYPYAQERWRTRTYGMHMIEGYFPHRELGIAFYEQKQLSKSRQFLEQSIAQKPSARAKLYLNRINKQQAIAAAPPPNLMINPLPGKTSQKTITLTGSASGKNPIDQILINGESEFIELAKHKQLFTQTITLNEGENRILIETKDLSNKQTRKELHILADWTPPQLSIQRNGAKLELICKEEHGIQHLLLNGQPHVASGITSTYPISPNASLTIRACDQAGNWNEWMLSKNEVNQMAKMKKPAPPVIHISNAGKTLIQYTPEYELDIRAEDDSALTDLALNGESLLHHHTPYLRVIRRIPLALGTNQLCVTANDLHKNQAEQHLTVIYKEPEYIDKIYRLAAIQTPLAGEIPNTSFAQRASLYMDHEITKDPVRFNLLSTDEEKKWITNEQDISQSALADPRAILNSGRKINADFAFISRIISDAPGQTIYTQVLDADSGKELFIEDIYVENQTQLADQLKGLVMKIEQRFPLIQTEIKSTVAGKLFINAGSDQGAQKGMRFLIIRSPGEFKKGHVIKTGNQPAELILSEVHPEMSKFNLRNGSAQTGDFVYTR